jgi:hypothetical protein
MGDQGLVDKNAIRAADKLPQTMNNSEFIADIPCMPEKRSI